jgi:hypothetical protein
MRRYAVANRRSFMPPQDLLLMLRKKPFEPFTLHLSDGTDYPVHHPELVMVGLASAIVGVAAPNQSLPYYERYETVHLRHIVRMVPLPPAPAAN